MNGTENSAGLQATGLAFQTLSRIVEQLFEDRAYEAHPGYGVPGDPHLQAIAQPDRELFEELAGLAHAWLKIIEGERELFVTKGLGAPGSYDFWYTLALAANKAATAHMDSSELARVPAAAIQTLFGSLLRFLPYACVQPGDCALRTADALISLFEAFPSDDMYWQAHAASIAASVSSSLLSAVQDRVRETHRAAHPFKQVDSAKE